MGVEVFEVRDEDDLREVFSSLRGVLTLLRERYGDGVVGELDTLEDCILSLERKCFPPPPQFYPPVGTVFVEGEGGIPLVVVERNIMFPNSPGGISFHDHADGIGEYPDWLERVRDGGVEIVWCTRMGKVPSNGDWLKSWGLK